MTSHGVRISKSLRMFLPICVYLHLPSLFLACCFWLSSVAWYVSLRKIDDRIRDIRSDKELMHWLEAPQTTVSLSSSLCDASLQDFVPILHNNNSSSILSHIVLWYLENRASLAIVKNLYLALCDSFSLQETNLIPGTQNSARLLYFGILFNNSETLLLWKRLQSHWWCHNQSSHLQFLS